MPSGSGWRSTAIAKKLMLLDREQFAVEFLRRNPAYTNDYQNTLDRIGSGKQSEKAAMARLARRWGLSFPACTRFACLGVAYPLVSGAFTLNCHRCTGS